MKGLFYMLDFKSIIADEISKYSSEIQAKEVEEYLEVPPSKDMGDYAFPCFKLAKILKKAPTIIATELKEKLKIDSKLISKIEIAGGYLKDRKSVV